MAVGALEQSGPHLPLGTNFFVASRVVDAVSRDTGIMRAPGLVYGVNLKGSEQFAGTAGLRRKTLHRAINELLADWEDHGVREFILVTSHPSERHLEALLMSLTSKARTTVFDLFAIEVSDLLEGEPGLEHGGERDTSLMLHLDPDRVALEHMADVPPTDAVRSSYRRGHPATPPLSTRGVYGYPSRGSAPKGRAIFDRYVRHLASYLRGSAELEREE
jgi:creatinine amidohydrolase